MSNSIKYKRIHNTSTPTSGGGGGTVNSVVAGTNITVDNTDPANPIINSTADDITVVANYSALPAVGTVTGEFYWCSASQGTSWLPGSLGGTYYNKGLYYSNGVSWEYIDTPYQATQATVNTGTNTDQFVTPATLTNATVITNKAPLASPNFTGTINAAGLTASQIVETDASKNLISAAKGTAYNKAFGTTAGTVTEGNDSRLTDARNSSILVKNFTPVSGTNVTTEEVLHVLQVPANAVAANDLLEIIALVNTNITAGQKIFRMYINTVGDLSGTPIKIATNTTITNGQPAIGFARLLPVLSDTTIDCISGATGAQFSHYNSGSAASSIITVPSLSAGFYVIITGQKSVGSDTDQVRWSIIRNSR